MNWYLQVVKKYAVFDGRARRKEYWMFVLFNIIIGFVLGILDGVMGTMARNQYGGGIGLLGGLYNLAVLIPSIAVGIRRLHDTNRSGWWMLIGLIPCVGAIVLIVFFATPGTVGENDYGADPKEVGEA